VIKSITDFGVFVGLPGNIDGLVHLSACLAGDWRKAVSR
jgi:ribosomal protein S1